MTLPTSGAISLGQVNTELGLSATATISLGNSNVRNLAGVASGAIAMSNLHGKSNTIPPTISIASYSNGNQDTVTLNLGGDPTPTTSGAWVSGGTNVSVFKDSNTYYRFIKDNGSGSASGTYRFTATNSAGSAYVDQAISVFESSSCFVAGSLVTMADGSLRTIETIEVGDWVRTAVGVSQVTDLYLPILGERALYAMADGKCVTSGEHSLWSRDPATGQQWWATRDMEHWRLEAITGDGPNFNGHEPFDLTHAEGSVWGFATESGWIDTTWHEVPGTPETQLYHLLLETGGSYFVDGYLVSSIADTGGVDWETFRWGL
jgi:hypothetical protein